jgi:hypothetical protein
MDENSITLTLVFKTNEEREQFMERSVECRKILSSSGGYPGITLGGAVSVALKNWLKGVAMGDLNRGV